MTKRLIRVNEKGYRVGESHHKSRLSDEQVELVRRLREEHGLSLGEISLRLGLPKTTVAYLCRYERRASLSFPKEVD